MVVRIRLQRFGRRGRPFYRVVVADARAPRDGKFIELVGTYNPIPNSSGVKEVTFKVDRVRYWVGVGAQPSDRVQWLLGQFGVLPPKVVPGSQTKQNMPRAERKGLKSFHTAACSSAGSTAAADIATGGEALGLVGSLNLAVQWSVAPAVLCTPSNDAKLFSSTSDSLSSVSNTARSEDRLDRPEADILTLLLKLLYPLNPFVGLGANALVVTGDSAEGFEKAACKEDTVRCPQLSGGIMNTSARGIRPPGVPLWLWPGFTSFCMRDYVGNTRGSEETSSEPARERDQT